MKLANKIKLSKIAKMTLLVGVVSFLMSWLILSTSTWWIVGVAAIASAIFFALTRLIVTRKKSVWWLKTLRPIIIITGSLLLITNGGTTTGYNWLVTLALSAVVAALATGLTRYECIADPPARGEAAINLAAIFLISNVATSAMASWNSPAWLVLILAWIGFYAIANFWLYGISDKPETFALIWALLGVELLAITSSWLVFYTIPKIVIMISQPALIIVVLAYSLGGIYYHFRARKLSRSLIFEYLAVIIVVFIVLLALTKWTRAV